MKTCSFGCGRGVSVATLVAVTAAVALLVAARPAGAVPFTVLGSAAWAPTGGSNPVGAEIDVDPVRDLVYLSAGMGGGSTIYRFDATSPGAITLNTNLNPGWGSGIGVDPVTGRYATTNGYSAGAAVFNPDATMRGSTGITGCGGSVAAGSTTFGVSTQCSDRFQIVDGDGHLLFTSGGIAVGSSVVYNPATGRYYVNSSSGLRIFDETTHAMTFSANPVIALEANAVKNLVYASAGPGILDVISGSTDAILRSVALGPWNGGIAVDTDLDRLYLSASGQIQVFDADGFGQIDSFTLPDGYTPGIMEMEAGDGGRLYVSAVNPTGAHKLFVLQARADTVPEPATLALLALGLAGAAVRRRSGVA